MNFKLLFILLISCPLAVFGQTYTLQDKDVTMANGVIQSCTYSFEIKDIIIPEILDNETVTGIANLPEGQGVFYNKGIQSVSFPTSLTKVGNYAFEANIIQALDDLSGIISLGEGAFKDNPITTFSTSEPLRLIGKNAFDDGCAIQLFDHSSAGFEGWINEELEEVTVLQQTTTSKGFYAQFSYTLTDEDVVMEENQLVEVHVPNGFNSIIIPEQLDQQVVKKISHEALSDKNIISIHFPESILEIGDYSFSHNQLLKVNLNDNITKIGEGAFLNNHLKSINIPTAIDSIGSHAFSNNKLKYYILPSEQNNTNFYGYLPSSKEKIYTSADTVFDLTSDLKSILGQVLTDEMVEMEGNTLRRLSSDFTLENGYISIPDYLNGTLVEHIGSYTFRDKKIEGILFPKALRSIGMYAFERNNIRFVNLPDSLRIVDKNAFYNNEITKVSFPDSLKTIGYHSFKYNNITEVVLPDSLELLSEAAFEYNKITKVKLPRNENLEYGRYAFQYNEITDLLIPKEFTAEGSSLFRFNQIQNVIIEEGIKVLPSNCFAYNQLTSVILPKTIQQLGRGCFMKNDNITVRLPKIEDENFFGWLTLEGDQLEGDVSTEEYLESEINTVYKYRLKPDDVVLQNDTIVDLNSSNLSGIKYLIFPKTINDQPISGILLQNRNSNYDEFLVIELEEGYEFIGDFFRSLNKISLPKSLKRIERRAFDYCHFKEFNAPENLEMIGYESFRGSSLEKVIFNEKLRSIEHYAFERNEIKEVIFPSTLKSLGYGAFKENKIEKVTLNEGIENIEEQAFYYNQLSDIVLPTSIKYIGVNAFAKNNMSSFQLPSKEGDATFVEWLHQNNRYTKDHFYSKENLSIDTNDEMSIYAINWVRLNEENTSFGNNGYLSISLGTYRPLRYYIIPPAIGDSTLTHFNYKIFGEMKGIVFEEGIEAIETNTFQNNEIDTIQFPSTLKQIGLETFKNNLIESLILPHSITSIGRGAFIGNRLESIILPTPTEDSLVWVVNQSDTLKNDFEIIDFYASYSLDKERERENVITNLENPYVHTRIFPNPMNDVLTINNIPIGTQIRILSTTGRVIYKEQATTSKVQLFPTLPAGVYLLQLQLDHQVTTKKIIKR
ncbi:leucine-rich repeat protein [Flammeovirga sp. EKP202]|uniref:leucine-rich repeat protein n=1 Tax=Flammeovirga sp. EKP202 TaxID=2770592 RepID=UPI00165F03F1|nr:leucine-rich repeat protein [Flammeovirga sp. EKP202]MBD0405194.1 leucine-rich repeat protein [Flammeovirga sp. EKP202]